MAKKKKEVLKGKYYAKTNLVEGSYTTIVGQELIVGDGPGEFPKAVLERWVKAKDAHYAPPPERD